MTDKEWAKVHSFVLVSETNQGKVVKTMTKREMYEAKTEEFLQPVVDEHGFELVDVEYVKEGSNWYLRAYIDKDGGIAVDDCEVISRILSDWLDKTDFIEDSYILEVSSPDWVVRKEGEGFCPQHWKKKWISAFTVPAISRKILPEF